MGLLHLLAGDATAAARLLAKAPGLGWSNEDHPGHVLFAAFADLLAGETGETMATGATGTTGATGATVASDLSANLAEERGYRWEMDPGDDDDDGHEPKPVLATPSVAEMIETARPGRRIDSRGRLALLMSMRSAATRRVEGLLRNKRRGHYGHAAMLLACCLELSPAVGKEEAFSKWLEDLRQKHSRFYAFRKELDRALASASSASS